MRVTIKDLERLAALANEITNSPATYATRIDGKFKSHVGHFFISQEYGGVCFCKVANEGGARADIFRCGHTTKKDLYNRIQAFLTALRGHY